MPLGKAEPFDHPDFLFELKYDGFRSLAVVESGRCILYSRNSHPFTSLSDLASKIGCQLMPRSAVLDGEIVCLNEQGHPQFNDLLFRRGQPCFFAFDLLHLNGTDLRHERLIDRKLELRRILGSGVPPAIYADHVDGSGIALFDKACELDLEGIVAKHKHSPYTPEAETTWFEIRNRSYSQWAGRDELFERERHTEPVPGWHSCALAAESEPTLIRVTAIQCNRGVMAEPKLWTVCGDTSLTAIDHPTQTKNQRSINGYRCSKGHTFQLISRQVERAKTFSQKP